ncbi:MAG TPA: D-alanine--D-alanine ligase, partial [Corynebacterium sp.]|nr:D-alanine--D-alanine ligase [Corynebacterium sp.]
MNQAQNRIRVAVIYGGRSPEHSVSCISAGAIMSHLDPERYEVIPVGITREGVWTVGESDYRALAAEGRDLPEVQLRDELTLSLNQRREIHNTTTGTRHAQVDVVLPILHGAYGEDGTVQGLLDMADLPYVGPGVLASAAGMDKEFTKKLMVAEGLPVTPEVILRDRAELT